MVAGGEELIFIAMERKSGGQLDLGCESVEKLNMKSARQDKGCESVSALFVSEARDMGSDLGAERNKLGDTVGGKQRKTDGLGVT